MHASTQSEWISIQHGIVRIDYVRDRCICVAVATLAPLLLLSLREVLLLLLVLGRHLLLTRRRHVGLLPGLLITISLARWRVCLVVLLWWIVAVQIVVCVEVVVFACVILIHVVLVKHRVRSIRRIILLFCTHELTLGRQSSTSLGDGGGVNLPSWSMCF